MLPMLVMASGWASSSTFLSISARRWRAQPAAFKEKECSRARRPMPRACWCLLGCQAGQKPKRRLFTPANDAPTAK